MDCEPQPDAEFSSSEIADDPEFASYGGAIFSGSQHFTVAGGTFTNVTKNYNQNPSVPSDFRRIPLGDIALQHEINPLGVVLRKRDRYSVRRVYSAKVGGQNSEVMVAMYQGQSAEEEWRRDMAKYATVRHPNIVQVCGVASSNNICAAIFADDLIPFREFAKGRNHEHFFVVRLYASSISEFSDVQDYFYSNFHRLLYDDECTFFIRASTGRLCADLRRSGMWPLRPGYDTSTLQSVNMEANVIKSLTLKQYHEICTWALSMHLYVSISSDGVTVNFGQVVAFSAGDRSDDFLTKIDNTSSWDVTAIASIPTLEFDLDSYGWTMERNVIACPMENGWTRLSFLSPWFSSRDIMDSATWLDLWLDTTDFWLTQANHIFTELEISSNLQHYVVWSSLSFRLDLEISSITASLPGYLFLCPPKACQVGPSSFKIPDGAVYWSLDPSGATRLSVEQATELGFPSARLYMVLEGKSWDASVYGGLRQFHQAKGFDPETQDLARHLGHQLYKPCNKLDVLHANTQYSQHEDDSARVNLDGSSENTFELVDEDPALRSPRDLGDSGLQEGMPIPRTFSCLMIVQLALILFLSLSWVYAQFCDSIGSKQLGLPRTISFL
ncbi:hypothetical protein C8R45DRAFT_497400 [Mycena sanguinolenta]|nr:hypothetical protein C8R45DRAFT_497400 [Mycena sanguinolenta]